MIPARRQTDRYIAAGFAAITLLAWALLVRRGLAGDVTGSIVYGVPAALMSWAAVGMNRVVYRDLARKAARRAGYRAARAVVWRGMGGHRVVSNPRVPARPTSPPAAPR